MADSHPSPDVADRARRRIMRRILPYLFLLYIINYLDRVNVSYANLEMTKDLHFTPEVFGFGAGIFFAGYFLLEIPGTLLIEVWSARAWIARIMITWGIIAVVMGFMTSATQFYWLRLGLGAAEAGFFPGIIVYLTHWFRYQDRAKAVALFMAAVPLSNFVGSPSFFPPFWALPTTFLAGSAAAASIGLINSIGNLGGFVGPYVVGYLNAKTNSFLGGMLYLSFSAVVGAGLILTLRQAPRAIAIAKAAEKTTA